MELSLDERSLPVFECLASATRLEILKFIGSEKKVLVRLRNIWKSVVRSPLDTFKKWKMQV